MTRKHGGETDSITHRKMKNGEPCPGFFKRRPVTTKNILIAEELVKEDLNWLIEDGVADDITAEIMASDINRVELSIVVKNQVSL